MSMVSKPKQIGGYDNDPHDENLDPPPKPPTIVRIEVLGDEKVGKTSLICTLISRHFSDNVPSVLLNVQLPAEGIHHNVILSITDTSSRVSDLVRVNACSRRCDAILLVYDLSRPDTFQRLRKWLELIRKHRAIPVVLAANKKDMSGLESMDGTHKKQLNDLMGKYSCIVAAVDCDAKDFKQTAQAFYRAQKAVLYPMGPLYNSLENQLDPRLVKAVKRTFRLFNISRTGILTRKELNEFQEQCYGIPLTDEEMDSMIEVLIENYLDGVAVPVNSTSHDKVDDATGRIDDMFLEKLEAIKDVGTTSINIESSKLDKDELKAKITENKRRAGLNFDGFLYLWRMFIDRSRPESCWQALEVLGYAKDLTLEIPQHVTNLPDIENDQSTYLTDEAILFLSKTFTQFAHEKTNELSKAGIAEIFSISDELIAPWDEFAELKDMNSINDADPPNSTILFELTTNGGVPLESWLACWAYATQEDPKSVLKALFYLCYDFRAPAIALTERRSDTRDSTYFGKPVVTCYVVCPDHIDSKEFIKAMVPNCNQNRVMTSPTIYHGLHSEYIDKKVGISYLILKETPLNTGKDMESELNAKADVLCLLVDDKSIETYKKGVKKLSNSKDDHLSIHEMSSNNTSNDTNEKLGTDNLNTEISFYDTDALMPENSSIGTEETQDMDSFSNDFELTAEELKEDLNLPQSIPVIAVRVNSGDRRVKMAAILEEIDSRDDYFQSDEDYVLISEERKKDAIRMLMQLPIPTPDSEIQSVLKKLFKKHKLKVFVGTTCSIVAAFGIWCRWDLTKETFSKLLKR